MLGNRVVGAGKGERQPGEPGDQVERQKDADGARERQWPWARKGRSIRGRSAERAAKARGGVPADGGRRGLQTDRPANTSQDVSRARNKDTGATYRAETTFVCGGRRPGKRLSNKMSDAKLRAPTTVDDTARDGGVQNLSTTLPSDSVRSRAYLYTGPTDLEVGARTGPLAPEVLIGGGRQITK